MLKENKGFTILETTISLSIFLVVTIVSINILVYSSKSMQLINTKKELLENSRIGLEIMVKRIKMAESITLTKYKNSNSLSQLKITYKDNNGKYVDSVFSYVKGFNSTGNKYNRLEFGNNEIAIHIADIVVEKNGDLLSITIETDNTIRQKSAKEVEPVILLKKINIKYVTFIEA
jgi:hypothetical protein